MAASLALLSIVAFAPAVAGDDTPTTADVQAALDAANEAFTELKSDVEAATLDRSAARRIASLMHHAERDLIKGWRRLDRGDLEESAEDIAEGVARIESARELFVSAVPSGGAS